MNTLYLLIHSYLQEIFGLLFMLFEKEAIFLDAKFLSPSSSVKKDFSYFFWAS